MPNLLSGVRYGVRVLLKAPGFAVLAITMLALGIAANTAMFSMVNGLLLRPLPYHDPERLVMVWASAISRGVQKEALPPADFLEWREQSRAFEQLAAARNQNLNVMGNDGGENLLTHGVSANYFSVLGVAPTLGRSFTPDEERPGHNRVVILSYGLWQRAFGGDPAIVGRNVSLDQRAYTVLGVMPNGFRVVNRIPAQPELWVPLVLDSQRDDHRDRSLLLIGRLKREVQLGQAQIAMDLVAQRTAERHPDTNSGWGVELIPLREQVMGRFRLTLIILLSAVGFILLIGCANIANLLLARAAGRHKEIAVRIALGSKRRDLACQFLMESCVLSGVGGFLGVALGTISLPALLRLIPDAAEVPFLGQVAIDANVIGCSAAVSLLCAVLFGFAPLREANDDLNEVLKDGGRSNTGGVKGQRLRGVLVIGQVAFSVVLLAGAGLMIQTFLRLQEINPGFEPGRVLTLRTAVRTKDYPDRHQLANFYRELVARLGSIPGVESAGAINFGPPNGTIRSTHFQITDQPSARGQEPSALSRVAHFGYFAAMRIPLLSGRIFNEHDLPDSPLVAIVSQSLEKRYWPNTEHAGKSAGEPVGKLIHLEGEARTRQIVGVIGDVRSAGADPTPKPVVYVPSDQEPVGTMSIMLRTHGDPNQLASAARKMAQGLDPGMAVYGLTTMEDTLNDADWQPRFMSELMAGFAGLALLLATIGIYSVVSYSVSQRLREIGIRIALGAESGQVLTSIIGNGLKLTLAGTGIGLLCAVALGRLLQGMLFGVQPTDPLTMAGVTVLLMAVAIVACYVPAHRASRLDPLIALRDK